MDYLDPIKRRRHNMILYTGYMLVAIAILIATTILLNLTYGYWVDKNGEIIQNGGVFLSSQPDSAQIYLNGKLSKKTNARLVLPAGDYEAELKRTGYRSWRRSITVEGGHQQRLDYPLLFPTNLVTNRLRAYAALPALVSQSPDLHWLLINPAGNLAAFEEIDLKDPSKAPRAVTLPSSLLTKATNSQSWQVKEWADDNRHLLLAHKYDDKTEYILLDRSDPAQSLNLNATFRIQPSNISFIDKKYDQYYLYDASTHTLQTANLKSPTPQALLDHVLGYDSYGADKLLYVTDAGASAGELQVNLLANGKTYPIRQVALGSTYLLKVTEYRGIMLVAAGSSSESKIYIYRNPAKQLTLHPDHVAVPIRTLRLDNPNYLSFSPGSRFVVVENGSHISVYDAEADKSYVFSSADSIDAPQTHMEWMDGYHLMYVSGGRLVILDYDKANDETLMVADPAYLAFFAPDYKYVYSLAASTTPGSLNLNQTALRTAADL
ncbi:MAG TPA: PEGA domain-containing protein [Candidatus Saccharimonadales bacterium]|nr:PEGA domain-containing protein [Candidatus Saccharimonadales bacterium]